VAESIEFFVSIFFNFLRKDTCQGNMNCVVSGSLTKLGRRQAVRHRFLVPTFGGSIPPAPAIFKSLILYDFLLPARARKQRAFCCPYFPTRTENLNSEAKMPTFLSRHFFRVSELYLRKVLMTLRPTGHPTGESRALSNFT
jgi:hypothetical protein